MKPVHSELYSYDDKFTVLRITLDCTHVLCRDPHHQLKVEYECGACRDEEYIKAGKRLDPRQPRGACHLPIAACRGCGNLCERRIP